MSAVENPPESGPRALAIVKVDTLGDLILFEPTLRALATAWPETRISVVIREAYLDLAQWLSPKIEWVTTSLDPFSHGPREHRAELDRIGAAIAGTRPDVFVAATSRHNWLETALAATSGAARRIALGPDTADEFFATQLKIELGIDLAASFSNRIEVRRDEPDWRSNLRLAEFLLGHTVELSAPSVRLDEARRGTAVAWLSQHGLAPGDYVVCAAAGFANVALKTWPADRYALALQHLHGRYGIRTVLVGQESEHAYLQSIAATAGGNTVIWTGGPGKLREFAAIIGQAKFYFGNDTGAMHLAAALDVPLTAVFGGGTWPRFVPASRRSTAIVQPLPCFGCDWDCAFGDAPCVSGITVDDVTPALDAFISQGAAERREIRTIEHLSPSARDLMDKAAARYRESRRDHLARQHKLEELTALDREKDSAIHEKEAEIAALKAVCNEREQAIFTLNGHVRNLQAHAATLEANSAILEKTLRELPPESAKAARALADQVVHIRNVESLLKAREQELAELKASHANRAAGLHDLEQAKHYGQMLAEKEQVIRELLRRCEKREEVIQQLSAETTGGTAAAHKLWMGVRAWTQEKVRRPFRTWLFGAVVDRYWMQIGVLRHYAPRPLRWDSRVPRARLSDAHLPQFAVVTPSYSQEKFIERTLRSVIAQNYPKLRYVVQDGGSKDGSVAIIAQYRPQLHHWESVPDQGQADAISRGFAHLHETLSPNDVMAWLNSDDLYGPGVLRYVAEYFVQHSEVDVVYGHRIIIDDDDREVGRWIMPRHDPSTLEWIDYVPQETMFWRKRAWDLVGGIDPSFQFALDWDLLARFQQAGCRIVRLPYFLGAFRVHAQQKTSQAIHTTGADEMRRIRTRFHGAKHDDFATIERHARDTRFRGALAARLHMIGIRW